MAINVSALTAYVDEMSAAGDIWVSTAAYSKTLQLNDVFSIYTGVKSDSMKVPKLAATATIADGDNCSFSASGDDTITQATITLDNQKVNKTWCIRVLEDDAYNGFLPTGQHYDSLADAGPIGSAIISETIKTLGNSLEINAWQDSTATGGSPGFFDGFLKQVDDASLTSAATAAALSSSNALAKVEAVVDKVFQDNNFASWNDKGELVCMMGVDAYRYYQVNYRATHGDYIHAQNMDGQIYLQGTNIPIVTIPGLTGQDYVFITPKQNFTIACDLASDHTDFRFGLDQYEENVWGKFRFKWGVGIKNTSLIKAHLPS